MKLQKTQRERLKNKDFDVFHPHFCGEKRGFCYVRVVLIVTNHSMVAGINNKTPFLSSDIL